jgi:hypothetical protein
MSYSKPAAELASEARSRKRREGFVVVIAGAEGAKQERGAFVGEQGAGRGTVVYHYRLCNELFCSEVESLRQQRPEPNWVAFLAPPLRFPPFIDFLYHAMGSC